MYQHLRKNQGRRCYDMTEPCTREERIDDIDQEIHKQSGWFKAAAGFGAVAIMALGAFNGIIISKLSSIETLLTNNQISIAEIKKDLGSHEQRIKDLEDRNTWTDRAYKGTSQTKGK